MTAQKICDNCQHFVREEAWMGAGQCAVQLPPWLYREEIQVGQHVIEKKASTKVFWNETCVLWEDDPAGR